MAETNQNPEDESSASPAPVNFGCASAQSEVPGIHGADLSRACQIRWRPVAPPSTAAWSLPPLASNRLRGTQSAARTIPTGPSQLVGAVSRPGPHHLAPGHQSEYPRRGCPDAANYSTVTDLARLRGWSTSVPRASAVWYARSCNGNAKTSGATSAGTS
jgi:hypothetical protein